MSFQNKSRFEVQRILRSSILSGLAYGGYNAASFTIMEANQKLPTARQTAVLFKMTGSERSGLQATKFRVEHENGDTAKPITGYFRDDCFIDQQTWLLSVLTVRPSTSSPGATTSEITADTRLAEDIAQDLIAWFNGPGCVAIRKEGVSSLYVKQKPVEVYKNSSSLYEKSASFQLKLLVPKIISHEIPSAVAEYDGNVPI